MQYAWGQRFLRRLFNKILEQAPEELAPQLAEKFIAYRAELAAMELVKTRPGMVQQELIKAFPEFALRQECYSQEGEDLILTRLFQGKRDGFFVDIGAHHPIRFSNTYLLYRLGWRGINVDAAPGSMEEFHRLRPADINIECLVSSGSESKEFHLLNEPALNTTSLELARQRSREDSRYAIVRTVTLNARSLRSILDEHLPPNCKIDLLNVDVEGLDLEVLESNDWDRYRPSVVLVELLSAAEATGDEQHPIAEFLSGRGYRITSRLFNTALFRAIE